MRNWGRWGPDDEIGTLNLVDDAARRRAAAAVESGRAFALGLPLSEAEGIQVGLRRGADQPQPHHGAGQPAAQRTTPSGSAPARTSSPWPPSARPTGTPWRTAATAACIYNGYPADRVAADGAARCGIHRLTTVVSRGVLLDVARALGREVLEPGYPITPGRPRRGVRRWRRVDRRAGRHRPGAHRPDGAPRPRAARTWSPTPSPRRVSPSRRPSGSTRTTSRRWPPTRSSSRSSRASTRMPTSPSTCCTWSRWA